MIKLKNYYENKKNEMNNKLLKTLSNMHKEEFQKISLDELYEFYQMCDLELDTTILNLVLETKKLNYRKQHGFVYFTELNSLPYSNEYKISDLLDIELANNRTDNINNWFDIFKQLVHLRNGYNHFAHMYKNIMCPKCNKKLFTISKPDYKCVENLAIEEAINNINNNTKNHEYIKRILISKFDYHEDFPCSLEDDICPLCDEEIDYEEISKSIADLKNWCIEVKVPLGRKFYPLKK